MRLAAALAVLALAGCATQPPSFPKEVRVPVPVPCAIETPKPPAWAAARLADDASIWDQVTALLAERRQRMAYQSQLEAALSGCQTTPTGRLLP